MRLRNRREAGQQLAERLLSYAGRDDVLVLALPRGGVPVAFEIAGRLKANLDVFTVRKLGVPGHEELAFGAIASGGIRVLNDEVLSMIHLSETAIEQVAASELKELQRREDAYRGNKAPLDVKDMQIILVDDGIATGATMRAAIKALRQQGPRRIIAAVPVGPASVYMDLKEADDVVCLLTPEPFYSVGSWYEEFGQTSDDEVRNLLREADAFARKAA